MVLPLVLIMILPKIMNDPETRKVNEYLYIEKQISNILHFLIKLYFSIFYIF